MSDADAAIARYEECGISSAIALERCPMTVVGEAVELSYEPSIRPEGIDLQAEDRHVGGGRGDVVLAAERNESVLERGAGAVRGTRLGQQATDCPEPLAGAGAPADILH
jgi:hypothetical protein